MKKISQKGFTIIELMITVAVLSFGVIGIYAAISPLIKQTSVVVSRFTASYLAQEGIEIARNIRDANSYRGPSLWLGALSQCDVSCQLDYKTLTPLQDSVNALRPYDSNARLAIDNSGFYSYGFGAPTKFSRKVTVIQPSQDVALVTVDVLWESNGKPEHFELQEYLYRLK